MPAALMLLFATGRLSRLRRHLSAGCTPPLSAAGRYRAAPPPLSRKARQTHEVDALVFDIIAF